MKLDNYYSDFISVKNSSSFRFYTFTKKTINFQLAFVPNREGDLFSGEEIRFGKHQRDMLWIPKNDHFRCFSQFIFNSTGISEKNVTFSYKNYKPLSLGFGNQTIILADEPNEVKVTLTGGVNATIHVNNVRFPFTFGFNDDVKNFRYASFALASELDYQEFFFECD